MYIQPVQHACPGTSLLMGDSTITVAGVISAITAITAITLSLSACTGYQYTHVLGMDTSPACQQHVGTYLQLWVACNRNNTNNICFAPMPWAAGIQHMMPKACTCHALGCCTYYGWQPVVTMARVSGWFYGIKQGIGGSQQPWRFLSCSKVMPIAWNSQGSP